MIGIPAFANVAPEEHVRERGVYQYKPIEDDVSLDTKVAFLRRADAYPHPVDSVGTRETHMSWVFLTPERVYKLKKPVRFPYLDFSTLVQREAACRAELRLNRELAPEIYLDVVPVTRQGTDLALGGEGAIVDWLVVMRRLDERQTMERAIIEKRVRREQLDQLATLLVHFYRRAPIARVTPGEYLAEWGRSMTYNFEILAAPSLGLPAGQLACIKSVQLRFLKQRAPVLAERVRQHAIVDCHGDLRPEHIWLGEKVRIIDRLEFNPGLRAVDPCDEIAFLTVECERLGARWVGDYIRRRVLARLHYPASDDLMVFYRCCRATLRARLAIAHLLEPNPRTPEKWPRVARAYLRIAAADAVWLERSLRRRASPQARGRHRAA